MYKSVWIPKFRHRIYFLVAYASLMLGEACRPTPQPAVGHLARLAKPAQTWLAQQFAQALQQNSIEAYQAFLERYPQGIQADSARAKRNRMAFAEAEATYTYQAFEDFLAKYPDASQAAEANYYLRSFGFINKSYLLGKVDYASHEGFVQIEAQYLTLPMRTLTMYVRKEAYKNFIKMRQAAFQDGIELYIVSAARDFYDQVGIWEKKWGNDEDTAQVEKAKKILRYTAMPGASRHHWGTDLDLNSVEPDYFEQAEGDKIYSWLQANAHRFGFFQTYTPLDPKGRAKGYEEEKWHWSFRPISAICLREYLRIVKYPDLEGFEGAKTAKEIKIIDHYVRSIGP